MVMNRLKDDVNVVRTYFNVCFIRQGFALTYMALDYKKYKLASLTFQVISETSTD